MGHRAQKVIVKGVKGSMSFRKEEPVSTVSGVSIAFALGPFDDIRVGEWGQRQVSLG